jgi:peptide/nickel transport system permease protein
MSLTTYILKRTVNLLITLFLFANFNFLMFEYIPMQNLGLGIQFFVPFRSPQQALHGDQYAQAVVREFGLDQPWPVRYEKYIVNIFTGNYGYCISAGCGHISIWQTITQYAPNSILLLGVSTVAAVVVGVLIGVASAARRGKAFDLSSLSVSLFFYSAPVFWIGWILLYFLAVQNHVFPLGLGSATLGEGSTPIQVGTAQYMQAYLWAAALPILVLFLITYGSFALIMRNTTIDVLTEDYVFMARAKGVSERTVLYKHAFRNALLPVVTTIALAFGTILAGATITETIFNFTGLGWDLLHAAYGLDYPVIQGVFFVIAIMVVVANFLADLAYAFLDPRVRY